MLSAGTTILCQRSVEHDDEDPEKYFEAACEEQAEKEQTFAELLQDDAADFEDSQLHLDSNFLHSFAVLLPLLETSSAGSSEASALTPHFLFFHCFFRTDASPQKLILHRLYLYDHVRVSSMSKFSLPMFFYFSVMDINFECAVRRYSRRFSCVFCLLPFFLQGTAGTKTASSPSSASSAFRRVLETSPPPGTTGGFAHCNRRRHASKEKATDVDRVESESQQLFREGVRKQVLEEAEEAAARDEPLPRMSHPAAIYKRTRLQFFNEYFEKKTAPCNGVDADVETMRSLRGRARLLLSKLSLKDGAALCRRAADGLP